MRTPLNVRKNIYLQRLNEAEKMLKELNVYVKEHKNNVPADCHYGHIGDVTEMNEKLKSIINFLNNYPEEQ